MDSESSSAIFSENDSDLLQQMVLLRLPGIGPSRYWQLCEMFGSVSDILNTPIEKLPSALSKSTAAIFQQLQRDFDNHSIVQQIKAEIQWCGEHNVKIITSSHKNYPTLLSNIHSPPPVLYVKGDVKNLSLPQLAVVGSRNPTPAGSDNAFSFSRELAGVGFAITSGLALGIDGAAHKGALAANGKTIAVLGTGIDKIYPQRHHQLANEIISHGGTIVSEFPLGAGPHASHFPRRNRIISGLSLGVLVVEAAVKSGSLITARYAAEHDREVFAIPGSIHNPLSRGSHALIKAGAMLVEEVDDLKEALQGLLEFKWDELNSSVVENNHNRQIKNTEIVDLKLSLDETIMFEALGFDNTTFDLLADRTSFETGKLLSVLMGLELKGLILQTPTGYIRATHIQKIK